MIWEDKVAENIQSKQQKEKRIFKNKDSLRDLWDTIKNTNIHIIELPKREWVWRTENLFEEIITENFSNLLRK